MAYIPQTNEIGAGARRQLAEFEDGFIVGKGLDLDHRDFLIVAPVLPDRLEDSGLF